MDKTCLERISSSRSFHHKVRMQSGAGCLVLSVGSCLPQLPPARLVTRWFPILRQDQSTAPRSPTRRSAHGKWPQLSLTVLMCVRVGMCVCVRACMCVCACARVQAYGDVSRKCACTCVCLPARAQIFFCSDTSIFSGHLAERNSDISQREAMAGLSTLLLFSVGERQSGSQRDGQTSQAVT